MNYYNDIDPDACAWISELQRDGRIPAGTVDSRSIAEVEPADLDGFAHCHFFAGIGGWAYALELAAWGSARPVWTASLPCQPFSVAGQRKRAGDERHLWPVFHNLVAQCQPATIFGEQVASADGRDWLAAVFDDLGSLGYIAAGADLCAAGVGAPHIRQRLYWCAVRVADSGSSGLEIQREQPAREEQPTAERGGADSWTDVVYVPCAGGIPESESFDSRGNEPQREPQGRASDRRHSAWNDVAYIPCADGKARPIESTPERLAPRFSPLVVRGGNSGVEASAQARTMRLKGYGNAIVPQLAAIFIQGVISAMGDLS